MEKDEYCRLNGKDITSLVRSLTFSIKKEESFGVDIGEPSLANWTGEPNDDLEAWYAKHHG